MMNSSSEIVFVLCSGSGSLSDAAGEDDDDELNEGDGDASSSDQVDVPDQHGLHNAKTSRGIDIVKIAGRPVTAGGRENLPVLVLRHAAAVQALLHKVPGACDSSVARFAIVDHAQTHLFGDLSSEVVLKEVGGDTMTRNNRRKRQ